MPEPFPSPSDGEPAAGEFDARFYRRAYPDVPASEEPGDHYRTRGRDEGRDPTPRAMNARVMGMGDAFDLLSDALDETFYLEQVPTLKGTTINPVQHYLAWGWRAGLDPSPDFSAAFYLARSPDVAAAGLNPFHHWLGWGRREGRAGHPDVLTREKVEAAEAEIVVAAAFDRDFYLRRHPELTAHHVDPVKHYLAFGGAQGFDPTPDFSTRWYLEHCPDVAESGMNPFHHYLVWGRPEGRPPKADAPPDLFGPDSAEEEATAREFDPAFYLARNPEVARTPVVPLKHWLRWGWRAGADPNPNFSTRFYLRQDPSPVDARENPLHHYMRSGRARGRLPRPPTNAPDDGSWPWLDGEVVVETLRPAFDADFYAAAYPWAMEGGGDPVLDYVAEGWRAGRDPAPWFSTADYLARYPDVEACRYNPFFHYLVWGRAQGFASHLDPSGGAPAELVASSRSVQAPDLRELVRRSATPPPSLPRLDPGRMDLHWVIPDIDGPGRGGLMTAFRVMRELERSGHACTIWILDPDRRREMRTRVELLLRNYQVLKAPVRLLCDGVSFPDASVLIATSWPTAHYVDAAATGALKAYLVQDDEAAFHPAGARALAADLTYDLDLACLCAGPWLRDKLAARGRWVRAFPLAADARYEPPVGGRAINDPPRIAFYARETTSRRAVELGLLAFEILARRGERFHVDLFGAEGGPAEAPYMVCSHGVLDVPGLKALYGACDLGVCFSATNYSLVPLEMMACGLPVVELDAEGARAAFPEGTVTFAGPSPASLADALARLLHDPQARAEQAARAADWVSGVSWKRSAQLVEAALVERIEALDRLAPRTRAPQAAVLKASVIIPTYNGGEGFKAVLAAVLAQTPDFRFEVVAVDSSSDDGTWEHLEAQDERVRRLRIPKAEFQHGRTRNLAASLARGELLCFLTQDALPLADWLYDLVTTLERFPRAAGAFGRHRARPEASPFVRRAVEGHFANLDRRPLEASKYDDLPLWRSRDEGFRRFLHFFSSNNACIRRSVWARHPLPEIDYGEDQAWAARIIDEGYSKVYAPRAEVVHSHDYTEAEMFERASIDARFQREVFGYRVAPLDIGRRVREMDAGDRAWAVRHGVSRAELERKFRLNAAEVTGMTASMSAGEAE